MLGSLVGALLTALVIGGLVYLGVVLTVAVLKTYRKRKASKILVANASEMIRQMSSSEKNKFSMSDLEAMSGSQVVAEYDDRTDEVVQIQLCDKGVDGNIKNAINQCGGYIVVED